MALNIIKKIITIILLVTIILILSAIIFLYLYLNSEQDKGPDLFQNHQLQYFKTIEIGESNYDIVIEVLGFREHSLILQIYNVNITDAILGNQKYVKPVFEQDLSQYDDGNSFSETNHAIAPIEIIFNSEKKSLTLYFENGNTEIVDISSVIF